MSREVLNIPNALAMPYQTVSPNDLVITKPTTQRAADVRDEARIAILMADASIAVAARIQARLLEMDNQKRRLAGDDPAHMMLLDDWQARTNRKVAQIYGQLFDPYSI